MASSVLPGERQLFLTDGGLETTLIFHEGVQLPHFAAFVLLQDEVGRGTLRRYYTRYLEIAAADGCGFILESPTWRSNPDWAELLGVSKLALSALNRAAIDFMHELRADWKTSVHPILVSGCIGPRGDGYLTGAPMEPDEATAYHAPQIEAFRAAGADLVTAVTCTNENEAVGIARAARAARLPVVISFTVETDGTLPTGSTLGDAIEDVDARSERAPSYYMINCAHPSHFGPCLESGAGWTQRIRGLRANASRRSHQELNDAAELDTGDPAELGDAHRTLCQRHQQLQVLGGCCGTDHRHIASISAACRCVFR